MLGIAMLATATMALADKSTLYGNATLEVTPGIPTPAKIEGQPATLLVTPDAKSAPTLNDGLRDKFKLKPSMIGFRYLIGPTHLDFWTDTKKLDFGLGVFSKRSAFGDNHVIDGADGEIGPGALPYGIVRFNIRPAKAGEQQLSFPLENVTGKHVGTKLRLGDEELAIIFSFSRAETLVTASAGAALADLYGGQFSGEPHDMLIRYGISRPVRALQLTQQPMLGTLPIKDIHVRVTDNGDASGITDGTVEQAAIDPDEIVVVGEKGKKKKKDKKQLLIIGLATLENCSSITYDFKAKQLRLSCI